jgi:Obg family GTPase CgtA
MDYKIPIPSMEKQMEIVETLDLFYEQIERNTQSIKAYERIKKGIVWANTTNCDNIKKLGDVLTVKQGDYITKENENPGTYGVYGGGDATYYINKFNRENKVVIAKGGRGGLGTSNFKSSINQAPTHAQKGEEGQQIWIRLQLKLLSDAGLLGMPNAGKSTFLSCTTRAKPKIADYPFTTLKPQLGVVYVDNSEFVLADIPGLIEGASEGKGLGDRFLKHIERCGVLLHLIDASSENIVENYRVIRQELAGYNPELLNKYEIIALNKIDLLDSKELTKKVNQLKKFIIKNNKNLEPQIFKISAVTQKGIEEVLRELFNKIKLYREQKNEE